MRFRNFVIQNFPFLEDDFDALTDYQLFCKMVAYVKKLYINNEKLLKEITANLEQMYEDGKFDLNNNIPYYSAISRQEIVERIKRYAGEEFDLNEFYANDVLDMQGNITGRTRSIEENAITLTGAGKQMPPKFMGDKPQLKKSNK